jgi:transcription elongation factor S-II
MGDGPRHNVRSMLTARLGWPDQKVRELESAIYNAVHAQSVKDSTPRNWESRRFTKRYIQKAMAVRFNLQHPKNPALMKRVQDGEVSFQWVCQASPEDLFPELWQPVYEAVARKQLRKESSHIKNVETIPDSPFQCRKCQRRKVTYYQMQTRSADEPMTTFFQCHVCLNRWKG